MNINEAAPNNNRRYKSRNLLVQYIRMIHSAGSSRVDASRGFALTPSRVLSVIGSAYFCRETRYCTRSIEAKGEEEEGQAERRGKGRGQTVQNFQRASE